MKAARLTLALALAALLTVLGAGPAAAAAPRLTEVAGAQFPDRAYALTLPKPAVLAPGAVEVRENGARVDAVQLLTADRLGGRQFGVVLAFDVSGSMRGRALREAKRAGRLFVANRRADQPVALITFAGDVRVALPFTTDAAALEHAIDSIAVGPGGSRIIDAAGEGVRLLREAAMESGSVVVLSDGADYESHAKIEDVTRAARDAGARVYSVGLRSGGSNFGTLNVLAASTQGDFSSAQSLEDLARVYRRLGAQLAHQYVVQYRSSASPSEHVTVEVKVAGVEGTAVAEYEAPALQVEVAEPFRHAPLDRFWTGGGAVLLLIVLFACLVAAITWAVLRPRGGNLRNRMSAFVGPAPEQAEDGGALTGRLAKGAERSLERRAWWAKFKERMDVARIEMAPVRLLAIVTVATLVLAVLLPLLFGSPAFALLGFGVPLIARTFVERRAARQRKLFASQLPDNLQVIASAMRAGHSFSGALSVVVGDAPEPTRREFERVVADERLGVPLEEALGTVVRRMDSKDLAQVALVAALQHETGGNTAEVLDRVTETVRDRMALQRLVNTLTAQGRMSRWVLTALPCLLLAVISAMNPAYVAPLFHTSTGRILLGVAAGMVCAGSFVIGRIVDIKV